MIGNEVVQAENKPLGSFQFSPFHWYCGIITLQFLIYRINNQANIQYVAILSEPGLIKLR